MKERIITGLLLVVFVFAGLVYANDYLFGVGVFWLRCFQHMNGLSLQRLVNKKQ